MVYMNIKALLKKINERPYYLVKGLDSNYTAVNKMIDNKTESISFEMLDKLCELLKCDVKDLLIRKKD